MVTGTSVGRATPACCSGGGVRITNVNCHGEASPYSSGLRLQQSASAPLQCTYVRFGVRGARPLSNHVSLGVTLACDKIPT